MSDRLAAGLQQRVFNASKSLREMLPQPDGSEGPWQVDDFLAQGHLKVGDIVLYARAGNLLSSFVKWATGSAFSHVGMIYYTPRHDQGFEHHFMIESDQNGVDLSPIKPYMQDPAVTIAILRVPSDSVWLNDHLSRELRGRLMETIADGYDFGAIKRLAVEIAKTSLFGVESLVRGSNVTLAAMRKHRSGSIPHAFICSGLVQVGYTYACLQAIKRGQAPPEALKGTIFRNDLLDWFELNWSDYTEHGKVRQSELLFDSFLGDLRATTPADIAFSENLEWRYLNTRGRVWRVTSRADAQELIK